MTPFWSDDHLTLYGGDCRAVLAELPAESVHCVVTSPPYWGLRDYGTATWEGGDEACRHEGDGPVVGNNLAVRGADEAEVSIGRGYVGEKPAANGNQYRAVAMGGSCGKCGARRIDSQLGLEATPEEYVANMVAVFREVRRVLRKDGTLWLNLGDSYWGGGAGPTSDKSTLRGNGHVGGGPKRKVLVEAAAEYAHPVGGSGEIVFKPKDLVGIPWRVALALQADGWYLRSDIIWSKPNPMPESVTDRPTKAHEYLFLLTKSPRYYFDSDAVREDGEGYGRSVWDKPQFKSGDPTRHHGNGDGHGSGKPTMQGGRNLRTVWNIATEPYPGAHFATFPRKLVEPCIKAGTSERGVCPECGAPWVRVVEREFRPSQATNNRDGKWGGGADGMARVGTDGRTARGTNAVETTGWSPSCLSTCKYSRPFTAEPVPAVVLDPFAGSGTTLFVAQALGRRGIGIDLSPEYLEQALARNKQTPLGLVG